MSLMPTALNGQQTKCIQKFHSHLQAKKTLKPPAPVAIQKGAERVGTGRFDALDEEVLKAIMCRVPFITLLACATSTCKAWRSLRDHTLLWNELAVRGHSASFSGYQLSSKYHGISGKPHRVQQKMCCVSSAFLAQNKRKTGKACKSISSAFAEYVCVCLRARTVR